MVLRSSTVSISSAGSRAETMTSSSSTTNVPIGVCADVGKRADGVTDLRSDVEGSEVWRKQGERKRGREEAR